MAKFLWSDRSSFKWGRGGAAAIVGRGWGAKHAFIEWGQRPFKMENVGLTFSDDALKAIARKAIARKTGARGLRSILEGILLDIMYELPTMQGVEEVVVNAEVVEGRAQPLLIYAEKKGGAASA